MIEVLNIDKSMCYEWLLKKHYAKRIPSIIHSYGLYLNKKLSGVITFGMPPSSTLAESVCGNKFKEYVIELNRLVVNDGLPKNTLSRFVSESIKMLPDNKIIVSFSDKNMGHNGYIYQATNFIYTGVTNNITKLIDKNGEEFHFRNIGHYQKNNRLKGKLIKRRKNEDKIKKIEIAEYLRNNKGQLTAKKLDGFFGYKDTAAHWFRKDSGFSFPSIDDWIKLKKLMNFDEQYDKIMTDYEWYPCAKDIIKKLELEKIDILPKNRYIYFKGDRRFKKQCMKNLKYNILPYPKGENKRYNTDYKPNIQTRLL